MSNSTCLNCGSSEMETPLLTLQIQGKEFHICPRCLPILIQKPYQLADKLPGIRFHENPPEHDQ